MNSRQGELWTQVLLGSSCLLSGEAADEQHHHQLEGEQLRLIS